MCSSGSSSRAEQGGAGSADSTGSGVQKGGSGNTHKDGLSRPLSLFFFFFFSQLRQGRGRKESYFSTCFKSSEQDLARY